MVKRNDVYEPFNRQLDILYNKYGKKSFKSREQLKILMRQQGLHTVHGKNSLPSDLQASYAWDYLESEYAPVEYVPKEFEYEQEIVGKKIHVIRDKRTGRFVRWLS